MEIFVDGLERSGNTFLGAALGYTLGTQVTPLWKHSISALESRNKDCPFIVPVRDILPSIVSSKIYRDFWQQNIDSKIERTGDPDQLIKRYSEYIEYLINHDDFFIAPFHEFTKDHNAVIDVIIKTFPGYKVCQRLTKDEIIEKIGKNPNPILNSPELNNFPREDVKNKQKITDLFISNYSEEIDKIQQSVEILYKRYYEKRDSI